MRYLSPHPITSGYKTKDRPDHFGVDIAAPFGTPLPALADGTVQFTGRIPAADPSYPQELIVIVQSDGYFIVYGHLSGAMAVAGQKVKAGQTIGHTGNSGSVLPRPTTADPKAGSHLHIEQRKGTKTNAKPLSAYPTIDITPLIEGDEMKTEDYLSDIFDVIADDPHYAESKPDAFKGHLEYVSSLDWAKRRAWFKQILTDNGVLNGSMMREYKEKVAALTGQLEDKISELKTRLDKQSIDFEQERTSWKQTEDGYIRDRERVAEEHETALVLKDAEIKDLNTLLEAARQNAKPVEKWTWQQHLAAVFQKLLGGGEPIK